MPVVCLCYGGRVPNCPHCLLATLQYYECHVVQWQRTGTSEPTGFLLTMCIRSAAHNLLSAIKE